MSVSTRRTRWSVAIRTGVAALTLASLLGGSILLAPPALACDTHVSGHYRSDGTYVPGHYRSCPNSTTLDNWTTKGNRNPYTSEPGSRSPYAPSRTCYFTWSC
jgi:hypothetical protein